ncbi:MAG: DNA repair protein RadC [Ruminococcaceae bacterium]|nr:DNA repair protein RadC [Oscillospiraceae bacterium]
MADTTQKSNPHKGHRERLKKLFLDEGLDNFQAHQILELLLFYAIPQKDTNEIAHSLLSSFGSLSQVFDAHPRELQKVSGISEHSSTLISMIPQLARAYLKDSNRERTVLDSSEKAGKYIKNFFMGRIYEAFYMFSLDNSCRIIHQDLVCEGTLDETPCYPRLVLDIAFRHNAQKVIFAHNHPSNILRPSTGDIESTKKLINAFESVDIEVVDHFIIGKDDYISMADIGCLR